MIPIFHRNLTLAAHLHNQAIERLDGVEKAKIAPLSAAIEAIAQNKQLFQCQGFAISCQFLRQSATCFAYVLRNFAKRIFLKQTPDAIRNFEDNKRMAWHCLVLAIHAFVLSVLQLFCSPACMQRMLQSKPIVLQAKNIVHGKQRSVGAFLQQILTSNHPSKTQAKAELSFSEKAVRAQLCKIYGARAVSEIFSFYAIKEGDILPARHIKAIVTGIQANLTIEDLQALYTNKSSLEVQRCYPELGSWTQSFEQLDEEKICCLLDVVRKPISEQSLLLASSKKDHFYYQLGKDIKFLTASKRATEQYFFDDSDPSPLHDMKKKFGYSEFFARDLIYSILPYGSALTSKGALFSFHNPKLMGKRSCRQILPHIATPGLLGINVIPIDKSTGPLTVQTVFRGTYDWSAVWRDSALLWPGHRECSANKQKLAEGLLSAVQAVEQIKLKRGEGEGEGEKIGLECIGHSLGAADAQRMVATIANMMAKKILEPRHIRSIKLMGWNPPAIAKKTNMQFIKNCAQIERNGCLPPIQLNHFKVAHDIVSLAGFCLLGYGSAHLQGVKHSVFKFARQQAASALQAHVLPVLSHDLVAGKKRFSAAANPNRIEDIRSNNAAHLRMLKRINPGAQCCSDERSPRWIQEEKRASNALLIHYWNRMEQRFIEKVEEVLAVI